MEDRKIIEAANNLIEAIYANMDEGEFLFDKEKVPPHSGETTHGNFIVGIHIREELVELENLIKKNNGRL